MERPLITIPTYVAGEVHGRSVREALAVLAPSPDLAQTGEVFAIESRGIIEMSAMFTSVYQCWQQSKRGPALCHLSSLDAIHKDAVAACVAYLVSDWELVQAFPYPVLEAFDTLACPFAMVAFPEFIYFALLADGAYDARQPVRDPDLEVTGFVLLEEGREKALTEAHRRFLAERYGVDVSGELVPVF